MSILKNQRGQGMVEYVVLVALIGVATVGTVRLLQHTIKVNLANVVHGLQSDESKRREAFERVTDDHIRKSDFKDFMNGTTNRSRD